MRLVEYQKNIGYIDYMPISREEQIESIKSLEKKLFFILSHPVIYGALLGTLTYQGVIVENKKEFVPPLVLLAVGNISLRKLTKILVHLKEDPELARTDYLLDEKLEKRLHLGDKLGKVWQTVKPLQRLRNLV